MANIFLKDLKKEVAEDTGLSIADVERVLRSFFNIAGDHLAKGDKLYLINFINIEPKDYEGRVTKHPKTGETMIIPPYRTVICSPTSALKEKLRKGLINS